MSNDVLLLGCSAGVIGGIIGNEASEDNQLRAKGHKDSKSDAGKVATPSEEHTSQRKNVIMPSLLSSNRLSNSNHSHTDNKKSSMSTNVPDVILLAREQTDGSLSRLPSSDSSDDRRESDVPASEESLDISTTSHSETELETESDSGDTTSTNSDAAPNKTCEESVPPDLDSDPCSSGVPTENENVSSDQKLSDFTRFRIQYLIVHTAIMLADGLQGTHLYVLYEGYGYSVSSLYALGFVAGALSSPLIGPIVDNIGRKKAAMLYCGLEIMINYLELFPIFAGLITSRLIGGITTNLLFTVFESWLVSEHRRRGFEEEKLEIILRDSTIVSNSAAIVSGYLAHCLASSFGPVGPFQGAVVLTGLALLLVGAVWNENYGSSSSKQTTFRSNMAGAFKSIVTDSKILRIGLIQGLSEGSLQTFVFLWSPALRAFARSSPKDILFLDDLGEPAYGLIFGAFMACGVVGGFIEPFARRALTRFTTIVGKEFHTSNSNAGTCTDPSTNNGELKPVAVDFLCTLCYLSCACLFMIPFLLKKDSPYSFLACVGSFFIYELMVGLYMPCEGVIRSIYMPNESICSLMTMLRVIVNVAVALGVISTNYVTFTSAFAALSIMMVVAAILQISLIPKHELMELVHILAKWSNLPQKEKSA